MIKTHPSLPPLALQLYSVREALAQDFAAVIEQIADHGYVGVETAFFPEHISVADAAHIIRANGLSVPAAHGEIPLGADKEPVLAMLETLACDTIVWHGWPQAPDYGSVAGVQRLAAVYNDANRVARANGLRFGIHNHWWEFEPVGDTSPWRILLAEMDESIFFEVDTYWVKTAGPDPVAVLSELGPRATLLHIKDGPATRDADMVAAGSGSLDIPAIFAAAEQPEWAIVELDSCATDMLTAVAQSYTYLTANGFSRGNV